MKIKFIYIILIVFTINLSFSTNDPSNNNNFLKLFEPRNYNRPVWNERDTKKLASSFAFTFGIALFMIFYKKKFK
jgi:hypothetical protein